MKLQAFGAALALVFASSTASADAVLSIIGTTGGDPDALAVGETVTLQITITNPNATSIAGLGLSVFDYDEAVVDFDSGMAVANYLNQVCVAPGSCFGGLENLASGALTESAIGANGNRVQIALSAGLTGVTNTGTGVDQGLDNTVGTSQFDVTFEAIGNGTTTLIVGSGYQGDGIIIPGGNNIPAVNDTITITVPEPGALAAGSLALGSVLAAAGIRRRL